mmetsp:Transcript_47739/g.34999  ORF Transcript_47739/g.34999 Transcript_47739/m.34999 type:complete len:98 (+) Transcript_47739:3188-3481(+)
MFLEAFAENQSWMELVNYVQSLTPANCAPSVKNLSFLERQTAFTLDQHKRTLLKTANQHFRKTFFSKMQPQEEKTQQVEKTKKEEKVVDEEMEDEED